VWLTGEAAGVPLDSASLAKRSWLPIVELTERADRFCHPVRRVRTCFIPLVPAPALLDCFAICAPGLEPLVREELADLSISGTAIPGGVEWKGSSSTIALANLWSRVASRVVVRIGSFRARTFFELERHAKKIEWERFVITGMPIRFRVTCRKSKLYHSDAVAQRFQEAVARRIHGDVVVADAADEDNDAESAAQLFIVRFDRDVCTVSADTSGALLHRRGYRQAVAKAPLRETLAAAMLRAAGWNGRTPLVDPMCGSGTIAIEGAMIARKIPPGLSRDFAFLRWPDAETARWTDLLDHARRHVLKSSAVSIVASDRDEGAIVAAKSNAERAGVLTDIEFGTRSISAAADRGDNGQVGAMITNPPYGERLGDTDVIRNLYAQMGNVARKSFVGWTFGMLSPDKRLDAQTRLPLEERFKTSNGGIPVHFVSGVVAATPLK
jgi:putative N6-adenine-specific DNA methylase